MFVVVAMIMTVVTYKCDFIVSISVALVEGAERIRAY